MAAAKRLTSAEIEAVQQWCELAGTDMAAAILKLIEEVRYFRALTDDYQQRTAPGTVWAKRRKV